MKTNRVALATSGDRGLEDEISDVFGRSEKITIVDLAENEVANVRTMDNPSVSYRFGAGPILVKALVDIGVRIAVGAEFGPGTAELMKDHKITMVLAKPGTNVRDAIKSAMAEQKRSDPKANKP